MTRYTEAMQLSESAPLEGRSKRRSPDEGEGSNYRELCVTERHADPPGAGTENGTRGTCRMQMHGNAECRSFACDRSGGSSSRRGHEFANCASQRLPAELSGSFLPQVKKIVQIRPDNMERVMGIIFEQKVRVCFPLITSAGSNVEMGRSERLHCVLFGMAHPLEWSGEGSPSEHCPTSSTQEGAGPPAMPDDPPNHCASRRLSPH